MAKNPFLSDEPAGKKDVFTDFLQTIVLAIAFSLILYLIFLVPSVVDGPSMEPNFYNKELLFANKVIQWLGNTSLGENLNYDYQRGDVIIFQFEDTNLIKRIIAAEGDTVELKNGEVFINNKQLVEYYLPESTKTYSPGGSRATMDEDELIKVPKNSYFVMGDNRGISKDSRFKEVGFVNRTQIRGRVFLRYWPITSFSLIHTGKFEEK